MCGIFASISVGDVKHPSSQATQLLRNRGPDHYGPVEREINTGNKESVSILFVSTVLALRGGHVAAQPLTDPVSGSVLCWNGEAWKINSDPVQGNDAEAVLGLLVSATAHLSEISAISAVLEILRSISGPFAFIFFDKPHNIVYFGRDRLGRRSLLFATDEISNSIQFSSIADPTGGSWKEIEADAVYILMPRSDNLPTHHSLVEADILRHTFLCALKSPWVSPNIPKTLKPERLIPPISYFLDLNSESVGQLELYMRESLKLRVLNIPEPPYKHPEEKARLAILFSGGLDCTVLARLVHDLLPIDEEIDLLNVAFENPRVVQASVLSGAKSGYALGKVSVYEACPDRITGRNAMRELQNICTGRQWNFVAINIPYTETLDHRNAVVSLMYPHDTEMDLSIATALYFAARGSGVLVSKGGEESVNYTTPARVLLSGLGADELFGGYTRHSTAFARQGYPGLIDELQLDLDRLGKRNLGRDDRIISHWGREARYPYLDEDFLQWALSCPVWEKCGFGTSPPPESDISELEPGKKVLRLLAWKLGMHSVAREKKRAIQFGSRTAKMETGRTKGTSSISR